MLHTTPQQFNGRGLSVKFFLLIFILSTAAFATQPYRGPLLVKTLSPDNSMPAGRIFKRCEVYRDKIVLSRSAHSISTTTRTQIKIEGNISTLIKDASEGSVTHEPAPTDAITTNWRALKIDRRGVPKEVDLKARGASHLDNDAPGATTLINFLDLHCWEEK